MCDASTSEMTKLFREKLIATANAVKYRLNLSLNSSGIAVLRNFKLIDKPRSRTFDYFSATRFTFAGPARSVQ
jgi:hypothetical protein